MIRHVVEKEGHGLVHLRRFDHVVVIEHEQPVAVGPLPPGAHELVDERGQCGGRGRGSQASNAAGSLGWLSLRRRQGVAVYA